MPSLHLELYQPYLLLLVGFVFMIISLLYKASKTENLDKTGERCEGIIFKLDYSNTGSSLTGSAIKDKITVRFVTNKNEWITEDLQTDFVIAYSGQYKEGEKVAVIYNPENPSEFTIETKQSQSIGRLIFFFVGLFFVGLGIYELLQPVE
jgi:hypothetical protein